MNSPQQILNKVTQLRQSRPEWDEAALNQMTEWEKALNKLIEQQEYVKLPLTIEILETLKSFVKKINERLVSDPEIPEARRHGMIADKNRCLWLIRLYSKNFDSEFQAMEEDIDFELET